jgi:hypothetical protein
VSWALIRQHACHGTAGPFEVALSAFKMLHLATGGTFVPGQLQGPIEAAGKHKLL